MLIKTQKITLKEKELCALEIQEEGVALAHISQPLSNTPELLNCDFFPHKSSDDFSVTLKNITNKYNLQVVKINWVLNPKYYRLFLIDIPAEVPQSEYKEAAKWQIKDIVEYPIEDLIVDIFEAIDFQKKGVQKLYVIAAQRSFLKKNLDIFDSNLLNVVAIDIREFALRNIVKLADKSAKPEEAVAHLAINSDCSILIIVQKNVLGFARRVPLGLAAIQTTEGASSLTTEIQRSLDYYRATFKKSNPSSFLIYPPIDANSISDTVLKYISENLTNQIQFVNLKNCLRISCPLSTELEKQCYIAIGGALRNTEEY